MKKGQEAVIVVKVAVSLVDVYVIEGKAFYQYNFKNVSLFEPFNIILFIISHFL